MSYFATAGQMLVEFVFGIACLLLLLRVMLQWVRADFHNPICQFLYLVTNPVLTPLGRVFPVVRGLNTAGLVVAWVVQTLKWLVLGLLVGKLLPPLALAVFGLYSVIDLTLLVLIILIVVRIVLSFVAPDGYHPLVPLLYRLTEPLMAPARALIPSVGGLDFSPILVMLALALARILVATPIFDLGQYLARG
ncbi:MAG TPA: YggT family protein [Xanthomonadaceae bacterium]|nr:YggT family protein [Xanthomonadaceae bacterium]